MSMQNESNFNKKNTVVSTVVSSDHYQHYVPVFCHSVLKAYPDIKIQIYINGRIDKITNRALNLVPGEVELISLGLQNTPVFESTINLARFLFFPVSVSKYRIITDIDFIWFKGPIDLVDWHIDRMSQMKTCYAGHHGPWKKPERFPEGWTGDKERVAGGFLMITPEWLAKTEAARRKYYDLLLEGKVGTYREEDEVVLCRIIKESGLPVPPDKNFPTELRGIHLGDFKFENRWKNVPKMRNKLTDKNCYAYTEMCSSDDAFKEIRSIVCEDPKVKQMFENLHSHISDRGFSGCD